MIFSNSCYSQSDSTKIADSDIRKIAKRVNHGDSCCAALGPIQENYEKAKKEIVALRGANSALIERSQTQTIIQDQCDQNLQDCADLYVGEKKTSSKYHKQRNIWIGISIGLAVVLSLK